jgi:hypothetical protein
MIPVQCTLIQHARKKGVRMVMCDPIPDPSPRGEGSDVLSSVVSETSQSGLILTA